MFNEYFMPEFINYFTKKVTEWLFRDKTHELLLSPVKPEIRNFR